MSERRWTLVIMTNKDVYHISNETAIAIKKCMKEPEKFTPSFEAIDEKTGAEITITISNVSSIVIPKEASHA